MFIPNSPTPPSGMAFSLASGDGMVVLLACETLEISLRLAFSKLKTGSFFRVIFS
jgi:hypothetical protein